MQHNLSLQLKLWILKALGYKMKKLRNGKISIKNLMITVSFWTSTGLNSSWIFTNWERNIYIFEMRIHWFSN